MNQTLVKMIGGFAAGGAWLALILMGKAGDPAATQFILFCQLTLATVLGHALGTTGVIGVAAPIKTAPDDAPTVAQTAPGGVLLPNGTVRPPLYVPGAQAGRVTPHFLVTMVMLLCVGIFILSVVAQLAGCAQPNLTQVGQIEQACAMDAGLRPTVDTLLPLATEPERLAVLTGRQLLDTVCKNPSAVADPTVVTQAAATTAGLLITLQQRRAVKP